MYFCHSISLSLYSDFVLVQFWTWTQSWNGLDWFYADIPEFCYFRVPLWQWGEDRWGGWANLLWRWSFDSERNQTITECQDDQIQGSQRCKTSIGDSHISCIFILHKNTIRNFICLQTRYGSLKIKGKKRPAVTSVNFGMWPVTDTYTLSHFFSNTHSHREVCQLDGLPASF